MSGEDPEVFAVAEDGSSGSSGSPSPGDTLPWNLGKTQRSRRSGGGSGANGSVLDPAERAVIRIAGTLGPACPLANTSHGGGPAVWARRCWGGARHLGALCHLRAARSQLGVDSATCRPLRREA
ncbi:hypothetical protein J0S82_019158 [Galemys pyrenaicus]|uniref:Microtubule-actin cross-linking factor 1 n=1 Tax=Galemys pyrenaicus TaxID=202257 RepID=A0A8J6A5A4_GALPY|nr:hypothetical protein J0S82_019158 [Galemys pyrenaicus]